MNDPTKENLPDLDIQLRSVTWSNKSGILEATFTDSRFDFIMNEDDKMFEELLPEGEYKYHDADGLAVAMIDGYFGMHILVRVGELVQAKYVYIKSILETIAERRFNDWK